MAAKRGRRPARRRPRRGGTATTRRALVGTGHVYLPDNRLAWWDAVAPAAAPIQTVGGDADRTFAAEFNSTLATVSGGTLARAEDFRTGTLPLARRIPWAPFAAADTIPGADFTFRNAASDGTAARFAMIAFRGDAGAPRRVVTSAARRSITIDFVVGQRAVGLECGFAGGAADRTLNEGSFKLRAWRSDGSPPIESTGADLSATDWPSRTAQIVAVRDDRGDIRTVELSCDDPGFAGDEFLFVHRLWHEPLPPAVVKQGTVVNRRRSTYASLQHAQHPSVAAAPVPPGTPIHRLDDASSRVVSVDLPHGCDSAIVILRGFRVVLGAEDTANSYRREPEPQKLSALTVLLDRVSNLVRFSAV